MRIAHLLGSFAALAALTSVAAAAPAPGSQLIDCSQADDRVEITVSSHLDPSCTWTRGVRITASDVVLDCQGARHLRRRTASAASRSPRRPTRALSNITVRNCDIEGFLNNVRINREGFRDLAEGVEYENAFSNIVIEDSTLPELARRRRLRRRLRRPASRCAACTSRARAAPASTWSRLEGHASSRTATSSTTASARTGRSGNSSKSAVWTTSGIWGTGREGLSIDGVALQHRPQQPLLGQLATAPSSSTRTAASS